MSRSRSAAVREPCQKQGRGAVEAGGRPQRVEIRRGDSDEVLADHLVPGSERSLTRGFCSDFWFLPEAGRTYCVQVSQFDHRALYIGSSELCTSSALCTLQIVGSEPYHSCGFEEGCPLNDFLGDRQVATENGGCSVTAGLPRTSLLWTLLLVTFLLFTVRRRSPQ